MILDVHLYATLRKYAPESSNGVVTVELAENATVSQLFTKLAIPAEEVKLTMVNGVHAELNRALSPGDRIGLFPPVGGG